jgi:diguanylate cyclase (GGDEF)-like protein
MEFSTILLKRFKLVSPLMLAPIPTENEERRIASLHSLRILDTDPEERYDRVTRLAKKLFDVPIALVSLVDENRQWFKSAIGLDVKETSREISFCGHTIQNNQTFIVENTALDKRFSDNPLVINDPYIQFYAGHPITAPSGENIGTLCIIDTKPRTLSNDDIAALNDLAALVTGEFMSLQLATMDELTNITNRRGFKRLGQHCIDLSNRQNSTCLLVYFDLNQFKLFNDNFGHVVGDQVLKIFAEQMKNTFRTSDVCARFGGDEFIVLLTDAERKTAEQTIKRLANNLISVSKHLDLPYQITFSYGIVAYDRQKHSDIEHLIHQADQAMYKNKQGS